MECAAVGIPEERHEEAVKLLVVRSNPTLREGNVSLFCHDHLTGYKRPKYIAFRDELPKSNVGIVLSHALRPETQ